MANLFSEWQLLAIWALVVLGVAYGLEAPKPSRPIALPDQDKADLSEAADSMRQFPPVFGNANKRADKDNVAAKPKF